jgi:hypothetical protein
MGGLGAPGVYVGTDAFGGAWAFDPWELYARRIMRSPNVIVLGGISYAKSTLIKTYIYRQYLFGRQAWVIDVKGEYGPLAAALGFPIIRLEPGGEVRLNPIERRGGREGQIALLRSVALAALRRDLHPEEDAALRVALDQVNEEAGVFEPPLPMVVDVLLHPREAMVAGVSAAGTARHRGVRRLARRADRPGACRRRRLHRDLPAVARPTPGPARRPRLLGHRNRAGDAPRDRRGDMEDRLLLDARPPADVAGGALDHVHQGRWT